MCTMAVTKAKCVCIFFKIRSENLKPPCLKLEVERNGCLWIRLITSLYLDVYIINFVSIHFHAFRLIVIT